MFDKKERKKNKMDIFGVKLAIRRIHKGSFEYTSDVDLSESLWLDHTSHFALVLSIPYAQAAISITIIME